MKIKAKEVWLRRAEGKIDECRAISVIGDNLWQRADEILQSWGKTAPNKGEGYDKCDFKVTFDDGEEYEGRFDLQAGGKDTGGCGLSGHIVGFLRIFCGEIVPKWVYESPSNKAGWEHALALREKGGEAEMARQYLAKYDWGI
jgi:hypothetical protein